MPDPSHPLDFPLTTPEVADTPLRVSFSEVWETIEAIRRASPAISDFMLMKELRLLPKPEVVDPRDREAFRLSHYRSLIETQLRLHLTHAYAYFTEQISDAELQTWRWYSWLCRNRDRLHLAVSFNYDLLFEMALQSAIPIHYLIGSTPLFGIQPEVGVFKPHGSINFEFAANAIHYANTSNRYAAKNVFELMNAPLRILAKQEINTQRLHSDIVLPTEASQIRRFQFIEPGFRFLKLVRGDISRCVIAGLSYWDCDRPEIDEILSPKFAFVNCARG